MSRSRGFAGVIDVALVGMRGMATLLPAEILTRSAARWRAADDVVRDIA